VFSPQNFTKVVKPVAPFLRKKAIRVLIYLDDFLLLAASMEVAVKNTQLAVTLLWSLGFKINLKKSLLIPTEVITFPGFQIDSMCMMISLPEEKGQQNSRLLLPVARFSKYQIAKPSKFNRPVRVLETSHLASSTTLSSLAVRSDKRPTNEPGVLQRFDCPVTECQSKTCVVVETHPQSKRQSHAPSSTGYDHN